MPHQTLTDHFEATLPWPLDQFQREALEKMETSRALLVSAPTSSGKTIIAEYPIWKAATPRGQDDADSNAPRHVIYTTPLKALSNQKFHDLRQRYGDAAVGLLTGEHNINDTAPILIMTTEILRNVIYDEPQRLDMVSDVILDEIHYMGDYPRGAVWEEIIISAPMHIRLTGLSATVGNIEEIATWIAGLRGTTATVLKETRPVELKMWVAAGNTCLPLLSPDNQLHPDLLRHLDLLEHRHQNAKNRIPSLLRQLAQNEMLPAICFVFSRRGCQEALRTCGLDGLDLTTEREKLEIELELEHKLMSIGAEDERMVFSQSLDRRLLRRGLAMHHAGMLPFAKETVERLFIDGLVKVVFATETLSLGLNMPARSCLISSFTKFNGSSFEPLTSGDLAQLTGRAGRRGIDTTGHGIVFKEPGVELATIYEAAVGSSPSVISRFQPTYSMTLSLLKAHDLNETLQLMEKSLGYFQTEHRARFQNEALHQNETALQTLTATRFAHPSVPCTDDTLAQYLELKTRILAINAKIARAKRTGRPRHAGRRPVVNVVNARKELAAAQRRMGELPCSGCKYLIAHRSHQAEAARLQQKQQTLQQSVDESSERFRKLLTSICATLEELGFLSEDRPTALGHIGAMLYGESSLIIALILQAGNFSGLAPAEMAAAVAMLTTEGRGRERPQHRFPTPVLHRFFIDAKRILDSATRTEMHHGIRTMQPLTVDYVGAVYDWARGIPLEAITRSPGQDIGDIVKAVRNVYSMLRQMEHAVPVGPLHSVTRAAREALERDLILRL